MHGIVKCGTICDMKFLDFQMKAVKRNKSLSREVSLSCVCHCICALGERSFW